MINHTIDIIVETPKGSREKYSYDPGLSQFRFKKALPLGMMFPYDFGFIPDTKGEDGDPLDALVLSEFKFFPGCMVSCRLIGAMLAEQDSGSGIIRNDRFFFIAEESVQYAHIGSTPDLPKADLEQLEAFFINYNKAEGKLFRPLRLIGAKQAYKLLKKQEHVLFND